MKLGISSFTFGWAVGVPGHEPAQPLDEHGLLDKARELGVALLQLGDNVPLTTFDAARIDRLGQRAADEGIALELGGRRLTPEHVAAYLSLAVRLRAKLVRFVVDGDGYHPAQAEIVDTLRGAIPRLEADDLCLGIENHDRFSAGQLRHLMQAVDHPRVGICLDTANSLGAGEGIAEVVSTLAPWTVNLHIKDFAIRRLPHLMGFVVEGRPAGGGMLDVPTLLASLPPARCRSAVLELWTPPERLLADTIEKEAAWAARSIGYLRPLVEIR